MESKTALSLLEGEQRKVLGKSKRQTGTKREKKRRRKRRYSSIVLTNECANNPLFRNMMKSLAFKRELELDLLHLAL